MRSDPVLKLNQKPHTPFGIASFIIGLVAMVLAIISVGLSAGEEDPGIIVGILGLISAMFTLTGFGVGLIGENDEELERFYAHLGIGVNSLMIVFHIFVVWFGFFII